MASAPSKSPIKSRSFTMPSSIWVAPMKAKKPTQLQFTRLQTGSGSCICSDSMARIRFRRSAAAPPSTAANSQ